MGANIEPNDILVIVNSESNSKYLTVDDSCVVDFSLNDLEEQ